MFAHRLIAVSRTLDSQMFLSNKRREPRRISSRESFEIDGTVGYNFNVWFASIKVFYFLPVSVHHVTNEAFKIQSALYQSNTLRQKKIMKILGYSL